MMSQVLSNYSVWMAGGGLTGQAMMKPVNMNPLVCIPLAFTANGLKSIVGMILIGAAIFIVYKLYNRFDGKHQDPRGFTKSDSGIYGVLLRSKAHDPLSADTAPPWPCYPGNGD